MWRRAGFFDESRYRTDELLVATLFHMELADLPTLVIATLAAMKINASISPYSTAVAALVDRISSTICIMSLPLSYDRIIVPEPQSLLIMAF
jgi:hypothetical protein